jgi:phenylacetate-CoA ligase
VVIERRGALDELTLECEPRDGGADREAMRALLAHRLRDNMGVRIGVRVLDPGTVPRSVGKAVRIVDRRASSPSERS